MNNNFLNDYKIIKNKLFDVAKFSIIATSIMLVSTYLPFLGLTIILIPVVFSISTNRNGFFHALFGAFFLYLPILILIHDVETNMFAMYFWFFTLGILSDYRGFLDKNVSFTLFAYILNFCVITTVMLYLGLDIFGFEELFRSIENLNAILKQTSALSGGVQITANDIKEVFELSIPSFIITICSFFTMLNFYIFSELFSEKIYAVKSHWKFRHFTLPRLTFVSLLIILITSNLTPLIFGVDAEFIFLNLFLIFLYALFMQGLACVEFFILSRFNRYIKIALIAFILFFLTIPLYPILILVGTIDYIFNLRKLDY